MQSSQSTGDLLHDFEAPRGRHTSDHTRRPNSRLLNRGQLCNPKREKGHQKDSFFLNTMHFKNSSSCSSPCSKGSRPYSVPHLFNECVPSLRGSEDIIQRAAAALQCEIHKVLVLLHGKATDNIWMFVAHDEHLKGDGIRLMGLLMDSVLWGRCDEMGETLIDMMDILYLWFYGLEITMYLDIIY